MNTRQGLAPLALLCAAAAAVSLGACSAQPRNEVSALDTRAISAAKARELFSQAKAAQKAGELDRAIDLYKMSLANNPDLGAAWHELGLTLMKRGKDVDFVQAGQSLKQAADLLPTDPTPYRNLGLLYQSRGFEAEALQFFESSLVINPYDVDSLRGAARSGKVLHKSDPATLDRLKRAQMIETDPAWKDMITRERIRVENDIREATERS